jgi:hypothetical protein
MGEADSVCVERRSAVGDVGGVFCVSFDDSEKCAQKRGDKERKAVLVTGLSSKETVAEGIILTKRRAGPCAARKMVYKTYDHHPKQQFWPFV